MPSFIEFRKQLKFLTSVDDPDNMEKTLDYLRVDLPLRLTLLDPGQKMYRVIPFNESGENVADFSYPPKREFCRIGRCNQAEQQMFYGGTDLGACINEMKVQTKGDFYRISVWEASEQLLAFNISEQPVNLKSRSGKIHSRLRRLFSHSTDKHYPQTSLISKWLFEQDFSGVVPAKSAVDAIIYPSVIETASGAKSQNFAIKKSAIDDGTLRLVECSYCELQSISETGFNIQKLKSGTVEQDQSQISWAEEPETHAIIPPGAGAKFTFDGHAWVADNPTVEIVNPILSVNH